MSPSVDSALHAPPPMWHLLQISDVLDLELADALAELVPVLAWEPQRTLSPWTTPLGGERERLSSGLSATESTVAFRIRSLPLLRGFSLPPVERIARTGRSIAQRLLLQTSDPERSPLICTTPYFAPVAEHWPGPVVYWLTDLIAEYSSAKRSRVIELDRRMCKVATLLCPNSVRLAEYLMSQAGAELRRIEVVPNATRRSNLLATPPDSGSPKRVAMIASIPQPIAGVIGNLAANMDWMLLDEVVAKTPWLHWVFVGPTTMQIPDPVARKARAKVMAASNAHFTGRQPYGALASFARSFDVAVLPYRRCEPTYSGSSTRFYEHLAASRPMIATRGLEELTRKGSVLTLVDTADQAIAELERLRAANFDDGLSARRWQQSQEGTWQVRARTIVNALAARCGTSFSSTGELQRYTA